MDQRRNAIYEAIDMGDLARFKELVGTDDALRNEPNDNGSWLHCASEKGQLSIVKYFVENGANVQLRGDTFDAEPITYAAFYGHLHVMEYLLSHGATLDVSTPSRNAIFKAIYHGNLDVARFLLDAGIDAHVVYRSVTGKLKNALSFAQEREEKEIADLLIKARCRLPIEGVDQPVWEAEEIVKARMDEKAHSQIQILMSGLFGPVDALALQEIVPADAEVHVAINVIRPNERDPHLTLFTTGMSDRAMDVPKGQEEYEYAELLMRLPSTWPHPRDKGASDATFWPFEWLRKIAYYPHLNETWLGGPMTIISSDDPPVPLGPNTQQTCLLLLANFMDWSPIVVEGDKKVRIYTVIPIFTDERDFEIKHGIKPLFERLQEHGYLTAVDVNRKSVARR
jgi:uncharacterized protein